MAKKRKKIWVQQVAVDVGVLETRLAVATSRPLAPEQRAAVDGIRDFLDRAKLAADRRDPVPSRVLNWWRGVLVEAAFRNVHAARTQLVDVSTEEELDAEIAGVIARAHTTLHRDDPRCISQAQLRAMPLPLRRPHVRVLMEDGYEALDLQHEQLRSFRNIILLAAAVISLLVAITTVVVSLHPSAMPLCFANEVVRSAGSTVDKNLNCPTRDNTTSASGGDVWIVALLGLLGGALAASVAIRNIHGTSTPYDVPVALAWLKVPLGAFTAILGIVAIHGGFVPGLSVLDSQQQILAYALLLGFAQQLFTGALDKKAQDLLQSVPSKEVRTENPPSPGPPLPPEPVAAETTPKARRLPVRRRR